MGYFVTKLSLKKGAQAAVGGKKKQKRGFVIGGAKTKHICQFTRQLSILQDAGLPILRSLKILEQNQKLADSSLRCKMFAKTLRQV